MMTGARSQAPVAGEKRRIERLGQLGHPADLAGEVLEVELVEDLSGGAAVDIAPHLTAPVEIVDNLVLEGVLALAEFPAKA